jgi:glutathione synthase/RimK-type ligase-like ATP-grasp enzyme
MRSTGITVYRLNTNSFPWKTRIAFEADWKHSRLTLVSNSGVADLTKVSAVWYRKESLPQLPSELRGNRRRAAIEETRSFLEGLYSTLDGIPWIDSLPNITRAEHKPLQLLLASKCGLSIPSTIITNDPKSVRRFVRQRDSALIVKLLSSVSIPSEHKELTVFTSNLEKPDLRNLDGLRYSPIMFQKKVKKAYDVRVTIVGRKLFPVLIDSAKFERDNVDWRRLPTPAQFCSPTYLSKQVRLALLRLMSIYGLKYGAVDLVIDSREKVYFLELNPCGDWSWLPEPVQHSIAEALCHLVTNLSSK